MVHFVNRILRVKGPQAISSKRKISTSFYLKGALDKYNIIPNFKKKRKKKNYTIRSVGIHG